MTTMDNLMGSIVVPLLLVVVQFAGHVTEEGEGAAFAQGHQGRPPTAQGGADGNIYSSKLFNNNYSNVNKV